jgi:hypothetical protein
MAMTRPVSSSAPTVKARGSKGVFIRSPIGV